MNTTQNTQAAEIRSRVAIACTATESGHHISAVADLAAARRELDMMIAETVAVARVQGETWAAIAASLGVTMQAAQQRYGR